MLDIRRWTLEGGVSLANLSGLPKVEPHLLRRFFRWHSWINNNLHQVQQEDVKVGGFFGKAFRITKDIFARFKKLYSSDAIPRAQFPYLYQEN
jgi:hypothetical protein